MDASNPVITSERVKFSEMRNDQLLLRRQDYAFLEKLVKEGRRKDPQKFPLREYVVDPVVVKRLEGSGVLPTSSVKLELSLTPQKDPDGKYARILPSEKYHVRGLNLAGPHVSVNRTFVSRKRLTKVVEALLKYNPEAPQEIEKVTYTGGTKTGFSTRLTKWAERRPKMMKVVLKEWGFDNPFHILRQCMPLKGRLLDWNQDLNSLLDTIYINRASSAGPPFFQQKALVQDKVYDALEEIAKCISNGTIKEFFEQNPEFLISECKNKMDRYEVDKVSKKTRPYWCFSAPICMLLSILCQDFCKNLATFDIDKNSQNAYGFSYAHGGGKRLWNWMLSCPEGQTKVIVYGDDVKKVFRKGGILYQVNPDFEQMDGSLDKDTVDITVEWIYKEYQLKFGDNNFFRYVCDMWKSLAIGSTFLVDGANIYSNKTGLLTGIVGTTLFDTVKSVLAYHLYEHQRVDPLNVQASIDFFAKMGLRVKEGTWDPQVVIEDMEEGQYCSDQKFLGANLRVIAGQKELEPVPAIEEEDLLKLIGNLRQQVPGKGTVVDRRLFDSARGYMITGAYLHPRLWNSMAELVERTPSTVITMRLQTTGESNGEMPEMIAMTGEDFVWPTTDGVPTVEFCKNVFLSKENLIENAEWTEVFPDLAERLKEYRKVREYLPHGKERNASDWNDMSVVELDEQAIENKREPVLDIQEGAILTNEKFRLPKHFVKFRQGINFDRKEEIMRKRMEYYESIHHQALEVLFPYGSYFITQQMLLLGFYPTPNGYWDRDPLKKMKRITSAWTYEAKRAIMASDEKYQQSIEPSTEAPSIAKEPDIAQEAVVVEPYEVIRKIAPSWKFPAADMDDISYVTSVFLMSGTPMKVATQVLSQHPSRIQIVASAGSTFIGSTISANKIIGKRLLFEKIRQRLTEPEAEVVAENKEATEIEVIVEERESDVVEPKVEKIDRKGEVTTDITENDPSVEKNPGPRRGKRAAQRRNRELEVGPFPVPVVLFTEENTHPSMFEHGAPNKTVFEVMAERSMNAEETEKTKTEGFVYFPVPVPSGAVVVDSYADKYFAVVLCPICKRVIKDIFSGTPIFRQACMSHPLNLTNYEKFHLLKGMKIKDFKPAVRELIKIFIEYLKTIGAVLGSREYRDMFGRTEYLKLYEFEMLFCDRGFIVDFTKVAMLGEGFSASFNEETSNAKWFLSNTCGLNFQNSEEFVEPPWIKYLREKKQKEKALTGLEEPLKGFTLRERYDSSDFTEEERIAMGKTYGAAAVLNPNFCVGKFF